MESHSSPRARLNARCAVPLPCKLDLRYRAIAGGVVREYLKAELVQPLGRAPGRSPPGTDAAHWPAQPRTSRPISPKPCRAGPSTRSIPTNRCGDCDDGPSGSAGATARPLVDVDRRLGLAIPVRSAATGGASSAMAPAWPDREWRHRPMLYSQQVTPGTSHASAGQLRLRACSTGYAATAEALSRYRQQAPHTRPCLVSRAAGVPRLGDAAVPADAAGCGEWLWRASRSPHRGSAAGLPRRRTAAAAPLSPAREAESAGNVRNASQVQPGTSDSSDDDLVACQLHSRGRLRASRTDAVAETRGRAGPAA